MKNIQLSGTKRGPWGGLLLCALAPECCIMTAVSATGEPFHYWHLKNVFNKWPWTRSESKVNVYLAYLPKDQILI